MDAVARCERILPITIHHDGQGRDRREGGGQVKRRIDKAYYRTGPQLRVWWPLNRVRRTWRAAFIHRHQYGEYERVRWLLGMLDMQEGDTRDGVTCLARVDGTEAQRDGAGGVG
jgi:hypothetical protein